MKIYPQWADKYPNVENGWMTMICNEYQFKTVEDAKNYFLTVYGGVITDEVIVDSEDIDLGFDPIAIIEKAKNDNEQRNAPIPEPDFEV